MEEPVGEKARLGEPKLTPKVTKQTLPSPELLGYHNQEVPHRLSSWLHLTAKALPPKGASLSAHPVPLQGVSFEVEQPGREYLPYTQLTGH